jgi:hypothetical protein
MRKHLGSGLTGALIAGVLQLAVGWVLVENNCERQVEAFYRPTTRVVKSLMPADWFFRGNILLGLFVWFAAMVIHALTFGLVVMAALAVRDRRRIHRAPVGGGTTNC